MKTKIVLSAEKFDALQLAAEEMGGVGSDRLFDGYTDINAPVCGLGLAWYAGIFATDVTEEAVRLTRSDALYRAQGKPFSYEENDRAVREIRSRLRQSVARVPFDLWVAEMGIERGESEADAPVYLTLEKVKSLNPCEIGLKKALPLFAKGPILVTVENVRDAIESGGSVSWIVDKLGVPHKSEGVCPCGVGGWDYELTANAIREALTR